MGNPVIRTVVALIALAGLTAGIFALQPPRDVRAACGAAGPFEFDTYEYPDNGTGYARLIEWAAMGRLPQLNYTLAAGDLLDLHYQGLETGPRAGRLAPSTAYTIPPSILKSIAWNESAWANAANAVPWGGIGPVLRSFDCGYGLGQVTSGMSNPTGVPTGRQAAIGTHPAFNLMESIRILADKWNSAPGLRPVAGNGNPALVEDWYYAIWSYNGFAFVNHPLNPARDPLRGPLYHCYSASAPADLVVNFQRADYTYPELVYGCMQYPPNRAGAALWSPQPVTAPPFLRSEEFPQVAAAFAPEAYFACTDAGLAGGCPAMDYPTSIPELGYVPNVDATADPGSASGVLGDPVLSVSGPPSATLDVTASGSATSVQVTVANVGTSLAAFRVQASQPWLVARRADDPAARSLDGGVAAGADVPVTVGGVVQAGYQPVLTVTVDPAAYPGGIQSAYLWIEPLYGGGGVYRIEVTVVGPRGPAEHRAVVPGASG